MIHAYKTGLLVRRTKILFNCQPGLFNNHIILYIAAIFPFPS